MSTIIHTGRVVDESGQALIGAEILTINSTPKRGVITDVNGNFIVDGSLHEVFQIQYLGFEPVIFRLDKYMGKPTYRLKEEAFQLDGFTGTPNEPYVPVVKKPSNASLWQIFGGVADSLLDNANVFNPIDPIRTQQIKVNTTTNGVALFSGDQITTTGSQGRVAKPKITNWLNDNPLLAGGFMVGAIALGAYAMNKN